jgi:hypothetical protein
MVTDICTDIYEQQNPFRRGKRGQGGYVKTSISAFGREHLARSKRGTKSWAASLLDGTEQRRKLVRLRWGETKEQEADGGARLMIETGAELPIAPTPSV